MNIKFLNATRTSVNSVNATYSLDDTEFTVEWNNTHPASGELLGYDLQLNTKSLNSDLAIRVDEAIRIGESDASDDLELYLAIITKFDAGDCRTFGWDEYTLSDSELSLELNDVIEGTYVVSVTVDDTTFNVNCQSYENHSYKETYSLSCHNYSGGDFNDSGLAEFLNDMGITEDSDCWLDLQKRIVQCAESFRPENTVLRVLREKVQDDTIDLVKCLFGAYGPTDISHNKYASDNGKIIVTSEDSSEVLAEKVLLGYIVFQNVDEYEDWFDEINPEGRRGDCSVSYRAWESITGGNNALH